MHVELIQGLDKVAVLHLVADRGEHFVNGVISLVLGHFFEAGSFVPEVGPAEGKRHDDSLMVRVIICMYGAVQGETSAGVVLGCVVNMLLVVIVIGHSVFIPSAVVVDIVMVLVMFVVMIVVVERVVMHVVVPVFVWVDVVVVVVVPVIWVIRVVWVQVMQVGVVWVIWMVRVQIVMFVMMVVVVPVVWMIRVVWVEIVEVGVVGVIWVAWMQVMMVIVVVVVMVVVRIVVVEMVIVMVIVMVRVVVVRIVVVIIVMVVTRRLHTLLATHAGARARSQKGDGNEGQSTAKVVFS